MAEAEDLIITESLCVNCEKNGETKLLPTKIPYFRSILLASFECPHCGYRNNEVQSLTDIQNYGEIITLNLHTIKDLDRQIVKSQHATIKIPFLEFEIPPSKGISSTIQGIISQAADGLREGQSARKLIDADLADKIEVFIAKLDLLQQGGNFLPFDFIVDDPSGNSYIENYHAPKSDPLLTHLRYKRTKEQLHAMGYYEEQTEEDVKKLGADLPAELKTDAKAWDLAKPLEDGNDVVEGVQETFSFPCGHCGKDASQNMCLIDIPGFRKCWVMAFVCDFCGAKSNEVKPAGAIGSHACQWKLKVETLDDLSRDVLKSDCAGIKIPELDLQLENGTLGGVFTTVEGLLIKIVGELEEKFPFTGDSQLPDRKERITKLIEQLRTYASGQNLPFTLILEDPADHSHIGRRGGELLFLQNYQSSETQEDSSHHGEDEQLTKVKTERTWDQNEELGLNDIKVENY